MNEYTRALLETRISSASESSLQFFFQSNLERVLGLLKIKRQKLTLIFKKQILYSNTDWSEYEDSAKSKQKSIHISQTSRLHFREITTECK